MTTPKDAPTRSNLSPTHLQVLSVPHAPGGGEASAGGAACDQCMRSYCMECSDREAKPVDAHPGALVLWNIGALYYTDIASHSCLTIAEIGDTRICDFCNLQGRLAQTL